MPDVVELRALRLTKVRQTKVGQDAVQNLPVQSVNQRPGLCARHHLRHGGCVAVAPGQGKGVAIHLRVALLHF